MLSVTFHTIAITGSESERANWLLMVTQQSQYDVSIMTCEHIYIICKREFKISMQLHLS